MSVGGGGRCRPRSAPPILVVTAGIAVAGFGALAGATGLEIFGSERGTAVGLFIWMIGSWLVATRFALKAFTYTRPSPRHAHRRVERPAPDARPLTGLRKVRRPAALQPAARRARPARPLPTPRIIHPTPRRGLQPAPSGIVLNPISTPTA